METEKVLGKRKREPLSWRGDPLKTFSDWTVLLTNSDDGTETTYHVHKVILSFGPRGCDYFAGVFDSGLQEQQDCTSRITLDGLDVEYFPLFLDFLYDIKIDFDAANVFGLKRLADYFGCEALKEEVMEFVQGDLLGSAEAYLHKASECNDKEIEELAREYLIVNIEDVSDDAFNAYSAELFRSVLFSPALSYPKLSSDRRRPEKIWRIWNSYAAANPHLRGCLLSEQNSQACNLNLGSMLALCLPTQHEKRKTLSRKDEFSEIISENRECWQGLRLDNLLEIDGSLQPGTTFLVNFLEQAQIDHSKVVSEKDELNTENEELKLERDDFKTENVELKNEIERLRGKVRDETEEKSENQE